MRHAKSSSVCGIVFSLLLLSACNMSTPSQMKTGEIQLKDVMKTATLNAAQVDSSAVNIIASDYSRNGNGPMRIVVPYVPGNPLDKVSAQAEGLRYRNAFAQRGIKDIRVDYAASADKSAAVVLSYMALAAEPPRDCRHTLGFEGADTLANMDRMQLGCEVKTAESRMISRPADLLGVGGTADDDGKRNSALVNNYRNGVSNPSLSGLNASTVGSTSVSGGGVSTGVSSTGGGGG